jgi:hypothetical protein
MDTEELPPFKRQKTEGTRVLTIHDYQISTVLIDSWVKCNCAEALAMISACSSFWRRAVAEKKITFTVLRCRRTYGSKPSASEVNDFPMYVWCTVGEPDYYVGLETSDGDAFARCRQRVISRKFLTSHNRSFRGIILYLCQVGERGGMIGVSALAFPAGSGLDVVPFAKTAKMLETAGESGCEWNFSLEEVGLELKNVRISTLDSHIPEDVKWMIASYDVREIPRDLMLKCPLCATTISLELKLQNSFVCRSCGVLCANMDSDKVGVVLEEMKFINTECEREVCKHMPEVFRKKIKEEEGH